MPVAVSNQPVSSSIEQLKKLALDDGSNAQAIINSMSLPEKVFLLSGSSFSSTGGVSKHSLHKVKVSDGPTDIRGSTVFNGVKAAVFPNATALASTWDLDIVREVGSALADEMRLKSVDCVLAPTLNLHRDPRGGRNQESYGEDPVLAGKCGSAFVQGVQSNGGQACLKHLVCNEAETSRRDYDVQVDDRVLREIYLRPFEIAVKEANPSSIMSAYNSINGFTASANKRILTDILRNEWKYNGMVMSDWFGTYNGVESIIAGMDLEMPFPAARGHKLIGAIKAGQIAESDLDTCLRRVIDFLARVKAPRTVGPEVESDDTEDRCALIRRAAAEAIVLMDNEAGVLPIRLDQVDKIAVIGSLATDRVMSHLISPSYIVDPLQGIRNAVTDSSSNVQIEHIHGPHTHRLIPCLDKRYSSDIEFRTWNTGDRQAAGRQPILVEKRKEAIEAFLMRRIEGLNEDFEIEMVASVVVPKAGDYQLSLITTAYAEVKIDGKVVFEFKPDGEVDIQRYLFHQHTFEQTFVHHFDRSDKPFEIRCVTRRQEQVGHEPVATGIVFGMVECADRQTRIDEAVEAAKRADVAVLFVGTTSEWEMEGVDREDITLPAEQEQLVRAVVAAKPGKVVVVNQSGAAVDLECAQGAGAIIHAHFGGQEAGNAIADVLFGRVNPSGKTSYTWPRHWQDSPSYGNFPHDADLKLKYEEGLFMGWKGYEREGAATPAYCFGHGLSYTKFEYADLEITDKLSSDQVVEAKVTIRNTGDVAGRETVQVYVSGPSDSSFKRVRKTLEGFVKTRSLQPGESQEIVVRLPRRAFAVWSTEEQCWIVEKGEHQVQVARSSAVIEQVSALRVDEEIRWTGI